MQQWEEEVTPPTIIHRSVEGIHAHATWYAVSGQKTVFKQMQESVLHCLLF